MAFTRKVIKAILDGITSGESTDDAVERIMTEHGQSISSYKDRLTSYEDVDLDALRSSDAALKDLNKKLGSLNLDTLISEHNTIAETLKDRKLDDILAENQRFREESEKSRLKESIDALLTGYKFTSSAAERDIRAQISALPRTPDGSAFVDADKIMPKIVSDNADAFVTTDMPKFSSSSKSGASNADDEQTAFLSKRYGGILK